MPTFSDWISIAGGNGVFVAVADNSSIAATSPNGITWTQRVLPLYRGWKSITYGNGLFVVVGYGSSVACTSPDGITWTQRALPVSANWKSVTYGNGVFVAVATSGAIAATSPDGITWTQQTLPVSANWQSVTYGNGVFVAVIYNGKITATSSDGVTWRNRLLPKEGTWEAVTYGNGLFVTIGSTVSNSASTSRPGAVPSTETETTLSQSVLLQTDAFTAPVTNPRIDRIGLSILSQTLVVFPGTEAALPTPPDYPGDVIPLCRVALSVGQTVVTNGHITDERCFVNTNPAMVIAGDDSAYAESTDYAIFTTPGTYNVVKPFGSSCMRISLGGAGGGGGEIGRAHV